MKVAILFTIAATTRRKTALINVEPVSVPLITVGVTKLAMMMNVIIAIIPMLAGVFPRFGTFLNTFKCSLCMCSQP